MKYLLPTGIGDSVWALHKIQGIAQKYNDPVIDIGLVCGEKSKIETRAMDFIRRFKFVNSVRMCPLYGILKHPAYREDGCWNYIEDGFYTYSGERWCVLVPNEPLERGVRLEQWLPDIPIRWDIWDDFEITNAEVLSAQDMRNNRWGNMYVVFYPGPLDGNTTQGHNRDMLWKPHDWIELGRRIHDELGLNIVVVGASYDSAYYDTLLAPNLNGASGYWTNLIGKTNIGELYSLTLNARFVVSYQSGVGIVSSYRGTPTAIFWRPRGNSIVRDSYLSFSEDMASAWVNPAMLERRAHLPLIYGRHDVDYIMREVKDRQW